MATQTHSEKANMKSLTNRSRTPNLVLNDTRSIKNPGLARSLTSLHPSQHPANTSTSKQMFSFGIGQRFKKPTGPLNHSIGYDQRSTLYDKDISFGIGPRTPNLVRKNFDKLPEPGAYKLPSDFEKPDTSYNAGKMFSFGAPREAYDRVYYKERIPHDRGLPGPGHYDQTGLTMQKNKNKSFTILGRIPAESHIAVKVHNPGPGTYRDDLSNKGRYVKSNDKNSCVPTFKAPTSKKAEQRVVAPDFTRDVPGPGSYTPRETSMTNKYRNSYNLNLHQRDRKIELHDKTKLDLPGPQHYILPSDFGNSHLNSTTGFTIPQQPGRRKRTRNNAALTNTKSTNLINMNQTSIKNNLGVTQKLSFTQVASPRMTDSVEPTSEHKSASNAGRRNLVASQSSAAIMPRMKIKRLSRPNKAVYGGGGVVSSDAEIQRQLLKKQLEDLQNKPNAEIASSKTPQGTEPLNVRTRASLGVMNRPKSGVQVNKSARIQKEQLRDMQKADQYQNATSATHTAIASQSTISEQYN